MPTSHPTDQSITSTFEESKLPEYNAARHSVETCLKDPKTTVGVISLEYSRQFVEGGRQKWLSVCCRTSDPTAGVPYDTAWTEMPDDSEGLTLVRCSWGSRDETPVIREDRFVNGAYVHDEEDFEFPGVPRSQTEQSAGMSADAQSTASGSTTSFCTLTPTKATSYTDDTNCATTQ
ncbi:hypothetical protein BCR39DRAFT_558897 [Naematelia encephala]|uniref:Uncharacterized protein n=1 Tax=Naematelia encephala TaxID=71784 RepID=A0A1Y2B4L6_9TREE|nr:hypothetical protein BCR39DRAFT_558897 [Naematelia encephala]